MSNGNRNNRRTSKKKKTPKVKIMSYHQVNNSDKLKDALIDVFNLDPKVIYNLLAKVSSIKPNKILGKIYQKSLDKEFITNEIIKLINEDLELTKEDFDLNEFKIQYFLTLYHPVAKISSFSCELKNLNDGAVIYDIVRIGKYNDEFYLYIPEGDN